MTGRGSGSRRGKGSARLRRSGAALGVRAFSLALLTAGSVLLGLSVTDASAQTMDDHTWTYVAFDELEIAPDVDERPLDFDVSAWVGGDYTRIWVKLDGEYATEGGAWEGEGQLLYSRLVSPFWEAQAGVGLQMANGGVSRQTRGLFVLGLEGLAPYWFEVEPQILVSHEGDVALSLEASYELLFTQRLVLEPEVELFGAVQEVPEFGIGSGLNSTSVAGRLRYEFVREFAPYVGVVWSRTFGAARDFAEDTGGTRFVAGLRLWY